MRIASLFLAASIATVVSATAATPAAPQDFRYKFETLIEGVPQPMEMQMAPDGRIFFIEIAGKLKIYHPDTKEVVEAGQIEVTNAQENGLLGMALDPDFAKNGFIYLLHSPKDFDGQVISRFTIRGDGLDTSSRKDLLKYAEQREQCCHHAGALRFGPDGCLYASSGDNTNPFASDGFSPHDTRPGRNPWDAQKSSANTNDLRGKILRIKPTPEGGYEIPKGNLFPPGTPNTRPEIYAMGFRNPWRFNIDQKTGVVYVGDVGPDSGQTKEDRGPHGFDTVSRIAKPAYFGWPYARGGEVYHAYDFETKQAGAKFDPLKPVNASPNNTGLKELPPVTAPLIWYPPSESKEFPILGKGGRTACAGPVFHYDKKYRETNGFPEAFDGCLLFYDWQRPFINWARMDKDGKLLEIIPFTSAARLAQGEDDKSERFQIKRPVDMFFGPEGALYLFDYGETWGANKDARLVKITYQSGNLAPVAKASAKNASGREPLTVELSSEGSKELEGEAVKYEWRLQPGDKVVAKTETAKLTIPEPGNYRAELRVTDPHGAVGTATVPIMVGNTTPEVKFVSPQEGDFFTPGQPVKYQLAVHDAEDGDSAAKADEFSIRTLVSATWTGAEAKTATTSPGLALMKQSDCFNCHAVEQQIVGPPLLKVAEKYRNQPGAENASVERVIKGSTGVWGQVGMLPHPQHSEDEVHMMVRWIFSLQPGSAAPALLRGLTGELTAPKDGKATGLALDATYTDAGRPPAGSLSGKAVIHLRSRRVEAESADEISGPQTMGNGSASGKKVLGSIAHDHSLKFAALNLSDSTKVTARVSSGGSGGKIEIRAGSKTGDLLATLDVDKTGDWGKYVEVSAPLKSAPRGEVYVVFVNPGKGGLMNIDWLQFNQR